MLPGTTCCIENVLFEKIDKIVYCLSDHDRNDLMKSYLKIISDPQIDRTRCEKMRENEKKRINVNAKSH